MIRPYCSRNGRIWYSVRRSMNANMHLRAVERRDRDEVEDHQQQVDLDEQEQDLRRRRSGTIAVSGARMKRSGSAADRGEDEVRERAGGRHDRLAAPAALRGSAG